MCKLSHMKGQGREHISGFIWFYLVLLSFTLFYLVLFGFALVGKVYDLFAEKCFGWKTLH